MEGRFYEPTEKICLIFSNEHYDELRELREFENSYFEDMPYAKEWADEFE